jgi:hypothetical protein
VNHHFRKYTYFNYRLTDIFFARSLLHARTTRRPKKMDKMRTRMLHAKALYSTKKKGTREGPSLTPSLSRPQKAESLAKNKKPSVLVPTPFHVKQPSLRW